MSPRWLLHDGRVFAEALVFSHTEQIDRLRRYCPEAVDVAVVAGDLCLDRLSASTHLRAAYRAALGVKPGQRLVMVSSTWGPQSLYGRSPELLRRLMAELPMDRYRVVAALHPNVWHGHSPLQVRAWLADCVRSGLVLVPTLEVWRAALTGADVVIGDHGSVTFYAATIGRPVLLASDNPDGVDPASPVARFCATAPRFALDRPAAAQLEDVIADPRSERYASAVADATSAPGRAAALVRALLYRLLGLPEPDASAVTATVDVPTDPCFRATATAALVESRVVIRADDVAEVLLQRYPAELRISDPPDGDTHLLVDWTHHDARLLEVADGIIGSTVDAVEDPDGWSRAVLDCYPGCLLAATPLPDGRCRVRIRGGGLATVDGHPQPGTLRPGGAVLASAMFGWFTNDHHKRPLVVTAGATSWQVSVSWQADPAEPPADA